MMTFRELVAYWSRIREVLSDRAQDLIDQELNKIMIGVDDPSAHFDLNDLKIKRQNIVTAFNNFEQEIKKLIFNIENTIKSIIDTNPNSQLK